MPSSWARRYSWNLSWWEPRLLDVPEGFLLDGGLEPLQGLVLHQPCPRRQHQPDPGGFAGQIHQVLQILADRRVRERHHLAVEVDQDDVGLPVLFPLAVPLGQIGSLPHLDPAAQFRVRTPRCSETKGSLAHSRPSTDTFRPVKTACFSTISKSQGLSSKHQDRARDRLLGSLRPGPAHPSRPLPDNDDLLGARADVDLAGSQAEEAHAGRIFGTSRCSRPSRTGPGRARPRNPRCRDHCPGR